jgi:hypothetical protein
VDHSGNDGFGIDEITKTGELERDQQRFAGQDRIGGANQESLVRHVLDHVGDQAKIAQAHDLTGDSGGSSDGTRTEARGGCHFEIVGSSGGSRPNLRQS